MSRCFLTDIGKNAVFYNFAIQIQYSGRSKQRHGAFSETLKKKTIQNHLYGQPVLTFAVRAVVYLNEH